MENSLEDQRATENGSPYGIIKCNSKGIARGDDRSIYTATLMKLSFEEDKTFYYLVTNAHCICEEDINSKSEIDIFYGELEDEKMKKTSK